MACFRCSVKVVRSDSTAAGFAAFQRLQEPLLQQCALNYRDSTTGLKVYSLLRGFGTFGGKNPLGFRQPNEIYKFRVEGELFVFHN